MNTERKTTGAFFTNSYIITNGTKDCIIVDPGMGYGSAAEYIKAKYHPVAVLITHAHIDHMDGLQYFLDLPVYIGSNETENFYDNNVTLYDMMGRSNPYSYGSMNLIPLKHLQTFTLLGLEFKCLFTPGHTSGAVCYLCGKNLYSGDTLFNDSVGRTDFPSGSQEKLEKSLKYLMDTLSDDIHVYPGHDFETTIGDERKHNPCIPR